MALAISARLYGETQNAIDILSPRTTGLNSLGFMTLCDAYLAQGQSEQALTAY